MSAESAGCEAIRAERPAVHPQRVVTGAKRPATTTRITWTKSTSFLDQSSSFCYGFLELSALNFLIKFFSIVSINAKHGTHKTVINTGNTLNF